VVREDKIRTMRVQFLHIPVPAVHLADVGRDPGVLELVPDQLGIGVDIFEKENLDVVFGPAGDHG
jgi:hypothetical protein